MVPYYESWKSSTHNHVPCIQCHYEPGMLESFQGKFRGLSQVAQYVTGTEGTKPWAEVSDQSCLRSGCHSRRLLQGSIPFGRIRFDHRHHLMETRRGKRLRCTTCHSQIVQGAHLTVTKSTCFICHFKPSPQSESLSDCLLCHGPPAEEVEIDGYRISHASFLRRGVSCRECHPHVTEGEGQVLQERCHSCHSETGHIERFGETEFVHEKHVTEHKVECFECHSEIRHGRLPEAARSAGACAPCHTQPHSPQSLVVSGTGAHGVDPMPGRMALAQVSCLSCHPGEMGAAERREQARIACLHCHGVGFSGMLERWQQETRGMLERLGPALAEAGARPELADVVADVRLVERDGSLGAHNFRFVRELLERTERTLREAGIPVADGPPASPRSRFGCTDACHTELSSARFPHGPHLERGGLDCDACHAVQHAGTFPLTHSNPEHGGTTITPADCGACHHGRAERACESCHEATGALLTAQPVEGVEPVDTLKSFFACTDCHEGIAEGHSPERVKAACLGCHPPGFAGIFDGWVRTSSEMREELDRLSEEMTRAVGGRGGLEALSPEVRGRYDRALRIRDFLAKANPMHNRDYAAALAEAAKADLWAVMEVTR